MPRKPAPPVTSTRGAVAGTLLGVESVAKPHKCNA